MRGRIRIAIACAGLLATSATGARAQTTFRETGSVTVGGYIVWVRGTSANVVQLFVGRGFRDAFAPAHEMDAAKLQQWIDSVRAIVPLSANDSSAVDEQVRGSAIGTDVTMLRRVGGPFSGLRVLLNGEDPITMAEPTARDFIAALDSAAHAARDLTPTSVMAHMLPGDAPSPATEGNVTVATVATAAPRLAPAPVPARAPAAAAVVVARDATPAPVMVATVTVAPAPAPTPVAPRISSPTSAPAASPTIAVAPPTPDSIIAQPTPELVLQAPSEQMMLLASRVEIVQRPLPRPAPPAVRVVTVTAADTLPDAPVDKLIHTPLGPFTIPGALLADRDKEAQYCYTQLGLKYNPDLKGEITVKLLVNGDGAVQDAVVTKRSWQGISAGEVESCVRALAHDWTFASTDPSVTGGAKILTFSFAPQVASAP